MLSVCAGWYGRRAAETPIMVQIPPGYDLTPLDATGLDELVIDLPPGVPAFAGRLIAQAQAVLVPCRPSPDDLAAAAGVAEALSGHPQWAFVLTQTLPRSRLTDGALRRARGPWPGSAGQSGVTAGFSASRDRGPCGRRIS